MLASFLYALNTIAPTATTTPLPGVAIMLLCVTSVSLIGSAFYSLRS